jgi:hypothetical protein
MGHLLGVVAAARPTRRANVPAVDGTGLVVVGLAPVMSAATHVAATALAARLKPACRGQSYRDQGHLSMGKILA